MVPWCRFCCSVRSFCCVSCYWFCWSSRPRLSSWARFAFLFARVCRPWSRSGFVSPGAGPGAGSPEGLPAFAWWLLGDPPAAAGPRSGGRAPGGRGRPGRSSLCPWPCALARFAALFLALLPVVVGVVLLLVAGTDRRRGRRACRCGPVVVLAVARPFVSLVKGLFLLKD